MRLFVAAAVLVLLLPIGSHAQTAIVDEYQVKAAFLLNFTRFVTWPSRPPSDTATPFTVCVAGTDPFGSVLDDVFEDHTVGSRPVSIRRQPLDASVHACQMLFVADIQEPHVRELLDRVDRQSVLTVGEGEDFATLGGIIGLTLQANRIRFSINRQQAERAQLTIRATLLNLATIVQSK